MFILRSWRVGLAVALALSGLSRGTNSSRAASLSQYLSPDFCAVLVIHPQRISQSTLGEAVKSGLPPAVAGADPIATAVGALKNQKSGLPPGMDPDKLAKLLQGKPVQRIAIFIDSTMEKNTPGSALVAQFGSDIDGEGILAALTTDSQPAQSNGSKYRKLKDKPGEPDGAALAPDNRTLILGVESTVVKMLAAQQGERPLLKQLQRASFDNDIILEYCAEPMWAGLTKASGKSIDETLAPMVGKDPAMAGMAKDIKSVSLRVNFSGKKLLRGEAATGKQETASMMSTIGQQLKGTAKQKLEELKKQPPPGPAAMLVPILAKVGDEALQGLEIKAEGPQMTVDLATPDSLAATLKALAQMVGAMIPAPPHGQ